MNFVPDERDRMTRFRKEAAITEFDRAVARNVPKALYHGAAGLGSGVLRGAQFLGRGKPLATAGILAGGAYAASQVPNALRAGRQQQLEALAPWGRQKGTVLI